MNSMQTDCWLKTVNDIFCRKNSNILLTLHFFSVSLRGRKKIQEVLDVQIS